MQSLSTNPTETTSIQFNTKATEFVPKNKIVKTKEQFPTLGEETLSKKAPQKQPTQP